MKNKTYVILSLLVLASAVMLTDNIVIYGVTTLAYICCAVWYIARLVK